MSSLRTPAVQAVLDRIHVANPTAKAAANERFKARRAEQRSQLLRDEDLIDIYGEAPMSVAPEVGELLYALAFSACPATIVEFGTSFGASTVYLAAALADIGAVGARVIACEAHPGKARLARENLEQAGLAGLVDVRQGDARETLDDLVGPIDMLFLDGLNRLYLPMLKMLEARLAIGALIVADLSAGDPDQPAYQRYVRDCAKGYVSVTIALDDGVELTRRRACFAGELAASAEALGSPA
jgi:predicted O-methyltransferase YrrM